MSDRFLTLLTSLAFALLLSIAVVPATYAQAAGSNASDTSVASPDVILHVEGLACQMCARSLANTLKKVEGVAAVQVLLKADQRVRLALVPEVQVDEFILREAVERAGFVTRRVVFTAADSSE